MNLKRRLCIGLLVISLYPIQANRIEHMKRFFTSKVIPGITKQLTLTNSICVMMTCWILWGFFTRKNKSESITACDDQNARIATLSNGIKVSGTGTLEERAIGQFGSIEGSEKVSFHLFPSKNQGTIGLLQPSPHQNANWLWFGRNSSTLKLPGVKTSIKGNRLFVESETPIHVYVGLYIEPSMSWGAMYSKKPIETLEIYGQAHYQFDEPMNPYKLLAGDTTKSSIKDQPIQGQLLVTNEACIILQSVDENPLNYDVATNGQWKGSDERTYTISQP